MAFGDTSQMNYKFEISKSVNLISNLCNSVDITDGFDWLKPDKSGHHLAVDMSE